MSGEAPAEFALIDEFAETPDEPAVEPIASEPSSEPDQPPPRPPEMPAGEAWHGEAPADIAPAASEDHHDEPPYLSNPWPMSRARAAAEPPAANEAPVPPSVAPHAGQGAAVVRRAVAAPTPASAALHVADGCRWPLRARLRRIHPPDRHAHRRRLRPAMERNRRDLRARSGGPRRQGDRDAPHLERHRAELAGRRRQPPAGGIGRIADL